MKGIIELAPKNINDYQGKKTLNFKIQESSEWFKIYKPEEELKTLLKIMTKGSEIEFEHDKYNDISRIEVTKFAQKQAESSGSNWSDDYSNFEDLLDAAHTKGLESVKTELIEHDFEKKTAVVHATVTMKDGKVFEAYGDATPDNLTDMIRPHFIRMAETRSLARAFRFATNNAKTAVEELVGTDESKDDTMNM